jgi:hypothetical protein
MNQTLSRVLYTFIYTLHDSQTTLHQSLGVKTLGPLDPRFQGFDNLCFLFFHEVLQGICWCLLLVAELSTIPPL